MLKLQIVSDIHIEFWAKKEQFKFLKPAAPILALLGDICCCGADEDFALFKKFINEILPMYQHIIMVAGNHEYWFNTNKKSVSLLPSHTLQGIDKKISTFFAETSEKLHYLNNGTITLTHGKHRYTIIGSTLWTWFPKDMRVAAKSTMNDYSYIFVQDGEAIRQITPDDVAAKYKTNRAFIKRSILKAKKLGSKVVMFTHHKPYMVDKTSITPEQLAYESDMSELFDPSIVIWAYGHTHVADNSVHGKTWFYSNPKGYPSQKTLFNNASFVAV